MTFKNNIVKFLKNAPTDFKPYYEKENDFKRLSILYSIAAFIVSPLFCILIYKSDVPVIYFNIGISYIVLFPLYILICFLIKSLTNKLIYFFLTHLFIITFFAFTDLLYNDFKLFNFFCFYCLFAVVLYVIQRLYAAILYNGFVLSLLIYGFQINHNSQVSELSVFGLVSVISFCSIIVLWSRQKMINSVEDYSNYLKEIVNNPGIGYVLLDLSNKNKKVVDFNTESLELLECSNIEISNTVLDYFSNYEISDIVSLRVDNTFNKTVTLLNNKTLEFKVSPLSLKNGVFWLMRIVDITDKIKEKEELSSREEKFRNLYYRNQAGVFTTDLESNIIDCNLAFEDIFEGERKKGVKLFEDDNLKEWKEILELIWNRETLRNYQTHLTLKNGTTKWFIFNWYIDKKNNFIEGTIIDLTEVQKTASALSQSEEKYRLIYEESNDAILLLDDEEIIGVNRKGIQLFGIPKRQLLGKKLVDLTFNINQDLLKEYKKNKNKLHLSKSIKFNWVFIGNSQKIEAEVAIIELMLGDKTYYQCVIHDLTLRNETMRSLEKNRQSFKSVLVNSPEGILILYENKILYANPEAYRLLSVEEIKFDELFSIKDQENFKKLLQKQKETKLNQQGQFKLRNNSVKDLLVEVTLVSTTFEDNEATLIIIKDISLQIKLSKEMVRAEIAEESNIKLAKEIKERTKTEKLLQEQFLRSNAIFESSSNTLLLTLDPTYKISSFNTHCQNYFSHVTNKKMTRNTEFFNFFIKLFKEKELRYFLRKLNSVKKGQSKQMESYFSFEGRERWLELFINPIFDIEGNVIEISLVIHDITEKKKSEKKIKESLKEKEILLKEIHHRVKNNLQVISSILNLQSSFVKDEQTLNILEESRNRIRSMAIIHENLYNTTNFSSIDFSEYLKNLSANLISSYRVQSGIINLKTDLEIVELVLDQAIPCGLLTNELITNSIKYAFSNNKDGEIFIGLSENEDKVFLKIEDNGVGLPADFDILKSDTLGLQLVSTLVEQLDGEITFTNNQGTKYLITFDKAKH